MKQNYPAVIYEYDRDTNQLVSVTPLSNEAYQGRRMASTIQLLAREWKKTGKEAVVMTSLGEMRYKENLRKKTREASLTLFVGAYGYKELRRWVCLACQYLMGEYPLLAFDFRREVVSIRFHSNRSIALDSGA